MSSSLLIENYLGLLLGSLLGAIALKLATRWVERSYMSFGRAYLLMLLCIITGYLTYRLDVVIEQRIKLLYGLDLRAYHVMFTIVLSVVICCWVIWVDFRIPLVQALRVSLATLGICAAFISGVFAVVGAVNYCMSHWGDAPTS